MGEKMCLLKLFVLLILFINETLLYPNNKEIHTLCPQLYEKTFRGYVPQGNLTAGTFNEIDNVNKLKDCVIQCCVNNKCNVVLMNDNKCFHINCNSNELCIPILSINPESIDHVSMVLVKPTDDDNWENILSNQEYSSNNDNLDRNDLYSNRPSSSLQDIYKDLLMDETSNYVYNLGCNVGIENSCDINEICIQNREKSRAGTCKCKDGYIRNTEGVCILLSKNRVNDLLTERILDITSSTTNSNNNNNNKSSDTIMKRKQLILTSENEEIKLPKNDVTLNVNVIPDDSNEDEKYEYEWLLLKQPVGSTAVKHQNGGQLKLSNLSEGLYEFKIIVSNTLSYGETFINVTVLPPSRINQPPKIIITPSNQIIKQPNTVAVLDASSTTDDDGIISWHWQLQQGPAGYQPKLNDSSILQLNDLLKPGNYTFNLTVTDTDKLTSSATANISVIKIIDYPPDANAGEDKIIYLPHNKIILNGNLSTDDHSIQTWEWIKSPDDAQKAVDMQDTRTPYLQLSNLEEGMYTFTLKVTDSANQTSQTQVHVFVKPPTNQPPIAKAGLNQTINLPQTWILLNANQSTDDNEISKYYWEQVNNDDNKTPPSIVKFLNQNSSITNVTGLTKGLYKFKLTITDNNNNLANDYIYITVNQNKNEKPKANAGNDFEIELPCNLIKLNGTQSTDDWSIVKWKWIRDEQSNAIGNIVDNSDNEPILLLTNLNIGKYIFNLTVYDEQGLSDTDQIIFSIKNDPKLIYLIDIIINLDIKQLTQLQYNKIIDKLNLLLMDGAKLIIRNLREEISTSKTKITFYVEDNNNNGKLYSANYIVNYLRNKLRVDESLLGFTITKLQTTICQNNCSGHGICNELTRKCECEAFWMPDMFKVYLKNDQDSDCSWSILYVVLGIVCSISALFGSMWALVYLCYNWCTKRHNTITKPTTYKLIQDTDDIPPFGSRKGNNMSDSDTDSDVVFESQQQQQRTKNQMRFGGENNRNKINRNGFNKMGRRIKT